MALRTVLLLTLLPFLAQAKDHKNDRASSTINPGVGPAVTSTSAASSVPSVGIPKDLQPCYPSLHNQNSSQSTGPVAPCEAVLAIVANCSQAAQSFGKSNHVNATKEQSCYCSPTAPGAGFWENSAGCANCELLHGVSGPGSLSPAAIPPLSSYYCGIAKPTESLQGYLQAFSKTGLSSLSLSTGTPSDVLGTSTEVSLYFTSTPIGAATSASSSATAASGGIMVPTTSSGASGSPAATGSGSSSSGSSSSAGAAPTGLVKGGAAAMAGVLGVALLL